MRHVASTPGGDFADFDFSPRVFARALRKTDEHYPVSDHCEQALAAHRKRPTAPWYRSQKEHVTGWLNELDGPGAYNRKSRGLNARHFWNHFQCAPGLLWVAEALGEDVTVVRQASEAAQHEERAAARCAAVRKVIPWARVVELVLAQGVSPLAQQPRRSVGKRAS
ncbi:hypothetical protein GCM10009785_20710 [Brooklawnia cerclae]|uniref:Uncharacterized protein n=1 Tax=Brooklawnia cerclae TaxID=349934 RepID=A0ABX0SIN8_9ACTN|nr:hypothetical protein [Brooklawnia cerclae]